MKTQQPRRRLVLNGAHRGGTDFVSELKEIATTEREVFDVHVVDPHPGRAAELKKTLSRAGITSTSEETIARTDPTADACVVVIDDAKATRRLLEESTSSEHFHTSLVVATNPLASLGGGAYGISTLQTSAQTDQRSEAESVFQRIDELSPTRETSANVSGPILNWDATKRARQETQALIARRALSHLDGVSSQPDLRIVDGSDGVGYQMAVIDRPHKLRRHGLKRLAMNEILPRHGDANRPQGVFFTESSDPRIVFVLAVFDEVHGRWVIRKTVDLPTPMPPELQIDFSPPPVAQTPQRLMTPRARRLFVTD